MHPVLLKTFGGLSARYYFRNFVFGLVIAALLLYFLYRPGSGADSVALSTHVKVVGFIVANTLLYPYSRFVYESVVGFVMGQNVFFLNAGILLFFKALTIFLCWALAVFIAPLGLLYLYVHHSRASNRIEG